jgi:hypothetical protein
MKAMPKKICSGENFNEERKHGERKKEKQETGPR